MSTLMMCGLALVVATLVLVALLFRGNKVAREAWDAIVSSIWLIICFTYVGWWSTSDRWRRATKYTALGILSSAALVLLLEIGFTIFGHRLLTAEVPHWVKVAVLVPAAWMVRVRWNEWTRFQERTVFATSTRKLIREAAALDFSDPASRSLVMADFVGKVLVGCGTTFDRRTKAKLNVMTLQANRKLLNRYRWPADTEYAGFAPELGVGAAGTACEQGVTIYVPAARYQHGIMVKLPGWVDKDGHEHPEIEHNLARSVYQRRDHESYRCVLSVPIQPKLGSGGVLNIHSLKHNSFASPQDMEIADVAAAFLAMAFDEYYAAGGTGL